MRQIWTHKKNWVLLQLYLDKKRTEKAPVYDEGGDFECYAQLGTMDDSHMNWREIQMFKRHW